jgi:hypothetical protein
MVSGKKNATVNSVVKEAHMIDELHGHEQTRIDNLELV